MSGPDNESTREKIRLAQQGDRQALDDMTHENIALVKYIVKRFMGRGKEYDDLFQLGCMGLIKAVKNFNLDMDVRFSTYAVPVIMGEIRRFMRDDGLVRVSRPIQENARKIAGYSREYANEHMRAPTVDEIASALNMDRDDVTLAIGSIRPARSLSEPVGRDEDSTLGDMIGTDEMTRVEEKLEVEGYLNALPEKERTLLVRRYFLQHTQSAIARDMGMTQVQVSRMESRILKRLREMAHMGKIVQEK